MTRKVTLFLAVLVVAGMLVAGCESKPAGPKAGKGGAGAVATPTPKLCAGCGQVKGSPGCCKLPKGTKTDVSLCKGCGQIKGSALCCKPGVTKCAACGLAKGSALCCKTK